MFRYKLYAPILIRSIKIRDEMFSKKRPTRVTMVRKFLWAFYGRRRLPVYSDVVRAPEGFRRAEGFPGVSRCRGFALLIPAFR